MIHVIGIDPGLEGGIVVMDGESRIVSTHRMPTTPGKRKSLDFFEIRALFERVPDSGLVGIELVSPQGNANGKVGTITAAKGVGIILGICLAMDLPTEEIPPQSWQRLIPGGLPTAPKGSTPAQQAAARAARKAVIIRHARLRWPTADLVGSKSPTAKVSSGIADACWIAEFARLRIVGRPATKEPA